MQSPVHLITVDLSESSLFVATDNQNVYHYSLDVQPMQVGQDMQQPKSQKRRTLQHKKKVSAMCITIDGQFLITGDKSGLIYIWTTMPISQTTSQDPKDNGLVCTYELHKDQGQINNLVAIRRPLSLFGLTANMKAYEVPDIKPL